MRLRLFLMTHSWSELRPGSVPEALSRAVLTRKGRFRDRVRSPNRSRGAPDRPDRPGRAPRGPGGGFARAGAYGWHPPEHGPGNCWTHCTPPPPRPQYRILRPPRAFSPVSILCEASQDALRGPAGCCGAGKGKRGNGKGKREERKGDQPRAPPTYIKGGKNARPKKQRYPGTGSLGGHSG